jgi:chromosomal replication initiation ATPase DnaA
MTTMHAPLGYKATHRPKPRIRPADNAAELEARAEEIRREEDAARVRRIQSERRVDISRIIIVVCRTLGIEPCELGGRCRHKRVVLGREIVTVLAREYTRLSFPEIARAMGKWSHSTFVEAAQRFTKQVDRTVEYFDAAMTKQQWLDLCRTEVVK